MVRGLADFGFKPKDSTLEYTLSIRMHGFTNCKITYMQLGYLIISNLPCICCKMLCKWLISYIHPIRKVNYYDPTWVILVLSIMNLWHTGCILHRHRLHMYTVGYTVCDFVYFSGRITKKTYTVCVLREKMLLKHCRNSISMC